MPIPSDPAATDGRRPLLALSAATREVVARARAAALALATSERAALVETARELEACAAAVETATRQLLATA
jgi:hypothetical protein